MHLVEILLPLYDREGARFSQPAFEAVSAELTERFGGLTAHVRAPAKGLWEEPSGRTLRDDIVIYEVMVESVDAAWWAKYRGELEERFSQDEIVIRAVEIRRL
ncbi:MAG TPA: hypothetical protein VEC19_08155 [Usitatibacter sp.]|nr:hypothetical protein [Usitatibacter sp.]